MESIRRLDDRFFVDLDNILAWASHLGVAQHTRSHTFRDNILWLRAHDKEEDRASIYSQLARQGRLTEMLSTMSESIELVETIPELINRNVQIPQELLRRVFSGPADTFLENDTCNQARNAMFELSMGAMAARQGLDPKLSAANPDVSFDFDGRNVKMECKRVLSESKIMERLREGIKQLGRSVQSGTSDIGIVAISLSKTLNPGDRFLVSDSPHEELSNLLTGFLRMNERRLEKMIKPSAAGILFYISSVAYVPSVGYSPVRTGTVFPLDLAEQPFLRKLAENLRV